MSSRPASPPNDGTGALCQSGCAARWAVRKPASRGQSGQSRAGSTRPGAALRGSCIADACPLIIRLTGLRYQVSRSRRAMTLLCPAVIMTNRAPQ
jgi:hypothetical protein